MNFIPPAKPIIGDGERNAVDRVMRSGLLAQGPEVRAFEQEFSSHFRLDRQCIAVNSGTSGLHLGLLAAGVGPGDEVIVPSFTFAATANAVALTGATPVFADIESDTFCLSAGAVREAISDRTKAILPVHLYGHPADMTALTSIASGHGLQLFEDAAQAHGALWRGKPVGSFGEFAMFSLYPTKNMTAGEGGIVSVARSSMAETVRLLRNQGMEQPYHNSVIGFNNRMTDINAAIGRVQLTKVDGWTATRRANAEFLTANIQGLETPVEHSDARHVYHQYTVRVPEDRDGFAEALKNDFEVGTGKFYPVPVHRLPSFNIEADLPETEKAAKECLSLPVHPLVSPGDLERIVEGVNKLAKAGS